jgi:hypothetical protein
VAERARALFEGRVVAVRALAEARRDTLAKRSELDDLERAEAAAYAVALSAGCTAEELKSLGFDTPARRPRGRPRTARPQSPRAPRPTADQPN